MTGTGFESGAVTGGVDSRRKERLFDAVAPEWAACGLHPEQLRRVLRLKERLGDLQGLAVFEPGCGTGRLTRYLAGWIGSAGSVIAVETNPLMAASASALLGLEVQRFAAGVGSALSISPGVTLVCGRAEDVLLPPHSVDLLLLSCVLPHFEDLPRSLARFGRVLRPEGRLVISRLEGRARLECFHQTVGGAVAHDRMPPQFELVRILNEAGLRLLELVDRDEEYYCEAVPERSTDGS
jgi:SAM-dependent methyltransferase